jgi:hypothetical protein
LAGDLNSWPDKLVADNHAHNLLIEDDFIPEQAEDQDVYWPVLGRQLNNGDRLLVAHGLDQAEALFHKASTS